MNEKKEYADEWSVSSQYFFEKGYYQWMAQQLKKYSTVLEIGCGTGYSTLALIEQGFRVIAVDKNAACIEKAKKLLDYKTINSSQYGFYVGDITDENFVHDLISKNSFDVVVCWNIGTYWSKEMLQYYLPHMLQYGLEVQQIRENPESSYSELIIWEACGLAKLKNVSIHIIDRASEFIDANNDPYYFLLRDEFGFSKITYANLKADSISMGGRRLTTNGIVNQERKVDIKFVSLLME